VGVSISWRYYIFAEENRGVQFLPRVKRRDRVEGNIAENLNCNRIKYGFALLEIIANS